MNYTVLNVGDKEYRLRMATKDTVAVERVLGTSPINELMKCANGQMPSFDFITSVLHASLQKYHHGMTMQKVYDLVDEAVDAGMDLSDFIPKLMDVFQVSGIIPKADKEDKEDSEGFPRPVV